MSEQNKMSSADAGSAIDNYLSGGAVDPNLAGGAGKSTEKNKPASDEVVPKKQYTDLETKLGSQGEELGKFRKLFEETAPFLEKLNENPELAKAILEDKIDPQLLEQILTGKINKDDAVKVSEAHKEVKNDLGKKEYDKMSPEDISKLIEEKVSLSTKETEQRFTKKLSDMEKLSEYQRSISDFISKTPDFTDFAEEIDKFLEDKKIADIEVAYNAVKGKALQERYKKDEAKRAGENAKELAANAGGGSGQSTTKLSSEELVDKLIGGSKNVNVF